MELSIASAAPLQPACWVDCPCFYNNSVDYLTSLQVGHNHVPDNRVTLSHPLIVHDIITAGS